MLGKLRSNILKKLLRKKSKKDAVRNTLLSNPATEDDTYRKNVEIFHSSNNDEDTTEEYKAFMRIKEMHPDYAPALNKEIAVTNSEELKKIIEEFGCNYPKVYIDFQLKYCYHIPMGDYGFEGFGWADNSIPPYMNLYEIVKDAREIGVPENYAPFKVDNGDYYCFDNDRVVIWDHNANSLEKDTNYIWEIILNGLKSLLMKDELDSRVTMNRKGL